jgi:hypothetical protein
MDVKTILVPSPAEVDNRGVPLVTGKRNLKLRRRPITLLPESEVNRGEVAELSHSA